jgi:hypothetical protein
MSDKTGFLGTSTYRWVFFRAEGSLVGGFEAEWGGIKDGVLADLKKPVLLGKSHLYFGGKTELQSYLSLSRKLSVWTTLWLYNQRNIYIWNLSGQTEECNICRR